MVRSTDSPCSAAGNTLFQTLELQKPVERVPLQDLQLVPHIAITQIILISKLDHAFMVWLNRSLYLSIIANDGRGFVNCLHISTRPSVRDGCPYQFAKLRRRTRFQVGVYKNMA